MPLAYPCSARVGVDARSDVRREVRVQDSHQHPPDSDLDADEVRHDAGEEAAPCPNV